MDIHFEQAAELIAEGNKANGTYGLDTAPPIGVPPFTVDAKLGQPTNADLERRLIGIEAWLAAADIRRQANADHGVTGRKMKGALETIDTRLATLEAAFGIAASKTDRHLVSISAAIIGLTQAMGLTNRVLVRLAKKGKKS